MDFEDLDLKGNSNASKNGEVVKQKPVTSNVIIKSESEGSKLKKKFFAEDIKTVSGHVRDSVIIPSLQKILSDMVKGGIDYLIYGSRGSKPPGGPGIISYTNYYSRYNSNVNPPINSNPVNGNNLRNGNALYNVNDVIFYERYQAEEVLLRMRESISSYGMVSVADFYELIDQRCDFTAQKWGWRDLRTADILRVDNGFSIRFPKIAPLE